MVSHRVKVAALAKRGPIEPETEALRKLGQALNLCRALGFDIGTLPVIGTPRYIVAYRWHLEKTQIVYDKINRDTDAIR